MSLVASVLPRGTGAFWGVGKEGKPLSEGTNVSQDAPSVLQEQDPTISGHKQSVSFLNKQL